MHEPHPCVCIRWNVPEIHECLVTVAPTFPLDLTSVVLVFLSQNKCEECQSFYVLMHLEGGVWVNCFDFCMRYGTVRCDACDKSLCSETCGEKHYKATCVCGQQACDRSSCAECGNFVCGACLDTKSGVLLHASIFPSLKNNWRCKRLYVKRGKIKRG
jgi:hypothetical protein